VEVMGVVDSDGDTSLSPEEFAGENERNLGTSGRCERELEGCGGGEGDDLGDVDWDDVGDRDRDCD
jgi:hypothetical protein